MSDRMIIFHVDDYDFDQGSKGSRTGTYDGMKKYWGHFITNKARRTEKKYAIRYEACGRWCSNYSHADFKKFAKVCDHVYITSVSDEVFCDILDKIPDMSEDQLKKLRLRARRVATDDY